jgi:putative transposase
MGRLARIVIPDLPHHVTQRGNRRANVFDDDEARLQYLRMPPPSSARSPVDAPGFCHRPVSGGVLYHI